MPKRETGSEPTFDFLPVLKRRGFLRGLGMARVRSVGSCFTVVSATSRG